MTNAATEALEAAVMAAGPDDEPQISPMLSHDPAADPGGDYSEGEALPDAPQIMSPEAFHEEAFVRLHIVGTLIATAKTGRDVDLVSLALGDHGRAASGAIYRVLDRYDFARRWFLTEGSNVMMDLGVILSYGQTVAAAIRNAPVRE